jgi:uncharacterized membrane protein YhhN
MLKTIALILFALVSVVHLAGDIADGPALRYATKPLLLPSLAFYYLAASPAPSWLLLAALASGWVGDLALMIPDPELTRLPLKLGIAAFLVGHLFYIALFAPFLAHGNTFPAFGPLFFLPYLALGALAFFLLRKPARTMLLPVVAYITVITAMGLSTVFSLGAASRESSVLLMCGAFSFMFSDIVNSYTKFIRSRRRDRFIIMVTYLAGQFLIVRGCLTL